VNDARNTSGQAYGLTVLTPILEGHESRLAQLLDGLASGASSPLARVPGTHFARWVVIGDVVLEEPDQTRDHLALARLLFTSNFDGPVEPYLDALRIGLGEDADAIWGHCSAYPGHGDRAAFVRYMRMHQIESALFFAAYGERTVTDVQRSLAARRSVIDFALRAQGLDAAELQAAFREAFPS
jgi:hypothetical protein